MFPSASVIHAMLSFSEMGTEEKQGMGFIFSNIFLFFFSSSDHDTQFFCLRRYFHHSAHGPTDMKH